MALQDPVGRSISMDGTGHVSGGCQHGTPSGVSVTQVCGQKGKGQSSPAVYFIESSRPARPSKTSVSMLRAVNDRPTTRLPFCSPNVDPGSGSIKDCMVAKVAASSTLCQDP